MSMRSDADLREALSALTPRLRRYARALATGDVAPSEAADGLVHSTLLRALAARNTGPTADLVIRLYATVTQIHREAAMPERQARAAGGDRGAPTAERVAPLRRSTRLATALLGLPLEAREVLLLVGLEGFDYAEAARILRVSRSVLLARLDDARTTLEGATSAAMPHRPPVVSRARHLRLVT
jgi:RNA polymerase sigma-70 factor, ECF subfamily